MTRYRGPRLRIVRRLGTPLAGLTRKSSEQRPYPPGQHGPAGARRRRSSDYAIRLREKQKVRFYYGISETQLRNYISRASRRRGPTGSHALALLELRLDNVVFRLGLAPTIPAARQLVSHGHILVNGARVSVPRYQVEVGDRIEVRDKSRIHPEIVAAVAHGPELALPSYLERDADGFGGRCTAHPMRDDVPIILDEKLVVEYYAR